jgi:predicted ribosomally synthesized peptide with nif11-like leader
MKIPGVQSLSWSGSFDPSAEVERFVTAARSDEKLANGLKEAVGVPAVVQFANRHGYNISETDMRSWLRQGNAELSQKELEEVTSGLQWGRADEFP